MTRPMTNDELIKHRSRIYRGYRAPQAVTQFEASERIVSADYNGAGDIIELVQEVTFSDGIRARKTTAFVYTGANLTSSTVNYVYEDDTPDAT